jgi:hypothetical protein
MPIASLVYDCGAKPERFFLFQTSVRSHSPKGRREIERVVSSMLQRRPWPPRIHAAFVLLLAVIGLAVICRGAVVKREFVVKWVPGAPDGFPRQVIGVFDKGREFNSTAGDGLMAQPFPGPLLRVRTGDLVIIRLHNELIDHQPITVSPPT